MAASERESPVLKNIDDLIASATRMHTSYNSGRMDRQIIGQWVSGLGGYPAPYAERIAAAAAWFKSKQADLPEDELKVRDLDMLRGIYEA